MKPLRRDGSPLLGQRQDGRDPRRFCRAHRIGVMAEISLRARVDAIGPNARLREIEIDLHDPPLAPQMLDQEGEPGLDAFARIAAALPQEGVFRCLLADRRSAPDPAARGIAFHRIFNGFEVEAVMRTELAVLGGDRRPNHVAVDLANRHPVLVRAASGDQHRRVIVIVIGGFTKR